MLRLFRNKFFLLALLTILLLVLIGVSSRADSPVNTVGNSLSIPWAPFQKVASFLEDKIGGIFVYFEDMK